MSRYWKLGVGLLLAGMGVACGDNPVEPPVPGTATLVLATSSSDDGAVLFTLSGPGIGDLGPAATSHVVYQRRVSADEVRVLVIGNLAPGALLRVQLADTRDLTKYTVEISQVATRTDDLREDLSGYSVAVTTGGG